MASTKRHTLTPEQRQERAAQAQQLIVDQLEALRSSDGWKQYLRAVTRFHDYSLNNVMLILAQRPDASRVAGYNAWRDLGQQVKKGEKGIQIFAPSTRKCDDETCPSTARLGAKHTHVRFRLVSVFDVSQTEPMEGHEPIPTLTHTLEGAEGGADYAQLAELLKAAGYTIRIEDLGPSIKGYTIPGKQIVLAQGLSPTASLKTLLHETAHNLLGHVGGNTDYQAHRGLCETEAESVAYVVAALLGHDTSDYSIGYIAGWSEANVDTVRGTALHVIQVSAAIHRWMQEGVEPTPLEGLNALEPAA